VTASKQPRPPLVPLVALGLLTVVAYGACYYAYGVLIQPISADTHWSAGFQNVQVLDGGKENWLTAGLPLEHGRLPPDSSKPREHGEVDRSSVIGRDDVSQALAAQSHVLLDLRSPEEYRGERVSPYDMPGGVDHGAERAGRIPGARHLYYRDLLQPNATLRPESEIVSAAGERGVSFDDPIILYCRLSHRASLGWLALTEAGFRDVAVYDGSWTEWGSLVGVPIER